MPSSYNGWPASRSASLIGINTNWSPLPGVKFPGGIKSGDVETIFTYLVQQLDKRVEKAAEYRPGDDWGWAYRANVNNPSTLSCHASGTAIDYNATQHPNRVANTWTREQAREIRQIVDVELAGVIKWLEGWDEMHFEIRGDRIAVAKVAKKIRDGGGVTPGPEPTPPEPPEPTPTRPPEDSVFILQAPNHPTRLIDPPLAIPIGSTTIKSAEFAGIKRIVMTEKEADTVISQTVRALD